MKYVTSFSIWVKKTGLAKFLFPFPLRRISFYQKYHCHDITDIDANTLRFLQIQLQFGQYIKLCTIAEI